MQQTTNESTSTTTQTPGDRTVTSQKGAEQSISVSTEESPVETTRETRSASTVTRTTNGVLNTTDARDHYGYSIKFTVPILAFGSGQAGECCK